MVERRRRFLLRLDAVELLDAAVHAVDDRIGKVLDPRATQRALVLDDPDFRDVNQLTHGRPSSFCELYTNPPPIAHKALAPERSVAVDSFHADHGRVRAGAERRAPEAPRAHPG